MGKGLHKNEVPEVRLFRATLKMMVRKVDKEKSEVGLQQVGITELEGF